MNICADFDCKYKDKTIDSILVDEAQFLEPAHVEQLRAISLKHNITVVCYGR